MRTLYLMSVLLSAATFLPREDARSQDQQRQEPEDTLKVNDLTDEPNGTWVKFKHRAVIVLREIEDMTYHEIAEVLKLSAGTVMSRLFYARKKLQSLLQNFHNPSTKTTIISNPSFVSDQFMGLPLGTGSS